MTLTDVATGWIEPRALKNKARRWGIEAIDAIRLELALPLLGLDSNNGSESINYHLFDYCSDQQITFTCGRPYRKNDSCHVEQKNWAVVRQAVGYARYDNDADLGALAEIYRHLRLLTQLLRPPSQARGEDPHRRQRAKATRHHDTPATPFQRMLCSGALTKAQARELSAVYRDLNPAQLRRDLGPEPLAKRAW